jgi:hypothetical protein
MDQQLGVSVYPVNKNELRMVITRSAKGTQLLPKGPPMGKGSGPGPRLMSTPPFPTVLPIGREPGEPHLTSLRSNLPLMNLKKSGLLHSR